MIGKLLGSLLEHTPGAMRVVNAAERALLAKSSTIAADMQAEARGELTERKHVCAFLLAKGHPELADSIAREEHWR
jgi:hypothetical protein